MSIVRRDLIVTVNRLIAIERQRDLAKSLLTVPRRAEFTLTNIAAGTSTTQDVTWTVPILRDYSVQWSVTCAPAAVGLVSLGVQAGSKTATGCTLIVANRTGVQIATAAFDVLAFPL